MSAPSGLEALAADFRHHLWGLCSSIDHPLELAEWDGSRWHVHLPPPSITGIGQLYACDTLGRLWLTTFAWNPPAEQTRSYAVYNPAADAWTSYKAMPDALQAAAAHPAMAFLDPQKIDSPPVFGGNGQVAYTVRDSDTTVYLYDGKTWRHWVPGDILGRAGGYFVGHLHFGTDGGLQLALDNVVWEWSAQGSWRRIGPEKPEKYDPPFPSGGPPGLQPNPPTDDLGLRWFVGQGAVYTAGYGLWVKQPELSAPGSPFRFGFGMEDAERDPAGRFFFASRPAGYCAFVVWSPPPVPKPVLSVTPLSADSFLVRFRSALAGSHWLRWRLSGGAWSAPTTNSIVKLTALARGNYRLEAEALDSREQVSPPAAAAFSVQLAPDVQSAGWVKTLLTGTEDAREAAVAGLIKQPAAALPALQAARSGASESGRWWIDAALQQIEEREPQR